MNQGSDSKYLYNTCTYYFYILTKFLRKCEHKYDVPTGMLDLWDQALMLELWDNRLIS